MGSEGEAAVSSDWTTGAAMKKLRLTSLVVLVHGTNRSPRSAEQRPGRPELSATVQAMLLVTTANTKDTFIRRNRRFVADTPKNTNT